MQYPKYVSQKPVERYLHRSPVEPSYWQTLSSRHQLPGGAAHNGAAISSNSVQTRMRRVSFIIFSLSRERSLYGIIAIWKRNRKVSVTTRKERSLRRWVVVRSYLRTAGAAVSALATATGAVTSLVPSGRLISTLRTVQSARIGGTAAVAVEAGHAAAAAAAGAVAVRGAGGAADLDAEARPVGEDRGNGVGVGEAGTPGGGDRRARVDRESATGSAAGHGGTLIGRALSRAG